MSLIETLKLINSHQEVRDYVKTEKTNLDGTLAIFKDGESFSNHPFFKKYPTAFRIQYYQYDLVVNNPLGTKVHLHKISTFYYLIQNLPPQLNSFLGGIHVPCLCYGADFTKYGFKKIIAPFLRELEHLKSTVVFNMK